ncbi:UvrD-helicase domain-containing protein [Candidatus Falkowbacteria bacterium]|nr:UvrD-helicase domain-containing protein [Candidatus Falkowbacteria bacterium]
MSLISESNEAQKRAITHGEGPQLIVAGAGTGKTRVVTARIAWLITEKNVNVDEVLALTFTEKAATEMEERVDQMLPYGYVDLWISTFHAFCDKILKRHALEIGLPNDYKLLDQTQSWMLVQNNLDRFNLDYYKPIGSPTKFIHALLGHFSRCKDEGIKPEDYLKYAEDLKLNSDSTSIIKNLKIDTEGLSESEQKELLAQEILRVNELANAFHVYQQILLENDAMDFADLINYTIDLLKRRPAILQKYRNKFKYILVDEFQDTNTVQYELIKMISAPKNNITVVGDDDQSIYKFRGASIANIMDFKKDFPGSKEVVLTENYRSCQEILDISYKFIVQNNPNRLEHELGIKKELKSHLDCESVIKHIHEASGEDEAKTVIEKIIEIKNSEDKEWSDFAILIRANSSAEIFISYLNQMDIPYQFLAMKGLYNKPIILDIVSYFKLLDNYHESSAVFRVLNFDNLNLSPEVIVKLTHYSRMKSLSLFETVKIASTISGIDSATVEVLNKLVAQIERHTQLTKNKKPTELLVDFIQKSGYIETVVKEDTLQNKEILGYLQQFYNKLQDYERNTENADLSGFLDLINLEMQAGDSGRLAFDPETGPDMVKIMTVHSSKGLEFDYIFLSHLVDRKFPTDKRKELIEIPNALLKQSVAHDDFHLEEERRLFYVAMTRAKKHLYFTSADNYGGVRDKKLSRFLDELGYKKSEIKKADLRLRSGPSEKQDNNIFDINDKLIVAKGELKYETPKRFSYSQMQTYEMCPYKYRFGNILKIPTFGNHYFSFGSTIHNTLQKFLELHFNTNLNGQADLFGGNSEKPFPPFEQLDSLYQENWIDEWYQDEKQKEQYRKNGKELLKNFYQDFKQKMPKVKSLEQPFSLPLGEYRFAGRIDRIDEVDGGVEIIDYKTGKPKGDKLATHDKRQLLFYQIAAEEVLGLPVKKLKYYYLEDEKNPEREFIGDEKAKDKLKQKFLQNISDIKNQKFDPKPSQMICKFCDYKDICEHRVL